MKFEGIKTWGWENALIGMRLPMSFDYEDAKEKCDSYDNGNGILKGNFIFGESDLKVMKNLVKADSSGKTGSPNSKFLRMIHCQICVTAPLYWWKEMDTYKIGTVRNSSSTMHKLASTPITMDCFEEKDLVWNDTVVRLERQRKLYNEFVKIKELEKAKKAWKILIVNLPESWLQTSVLDLNYETLRNIYAWRKNHKLTEWHQFCKVIEELPLAKELIIGDVNECK